MDETLRFYSQYGLIKTFIFFYCKIMTRYYEKSHNIITGGVELKKLNKNSNLKSFQFLTGTESVPVPMIRKILNSLSITSKDIIVDLGSGDGRLLFVASEFNFKEIIGVEFLEELFVRSSKNLSNFMRVKGKSNIKLIHSDVLDYNFSGKETYFYLYNPFESKVMHKFLNKMKNELWGKINFIKIVYVSPKCHDVLISQNFKVIDRININHKICLVYTYDNKK